MRIALLSYRSKPHCGGQGVYIRHLSRELVALGHTVEVFSGQPYPELDEGVRLTKVPEPRPLPRAGPVPDAEAPGVPRPDRRRGVPDDVDGRASPSRRRSASGRRGCCGTPRRLRRRARQPGARPRDARHRADGPAAGHDASTTRSPSTGASTSRRRRPGARSSRLRRWYGFLRMQSRSPAASARSSPSRSRAGATSSATSASTDSEIEVIPLGVDDVFGPPTTPRVPGRIVAMASADAPMKGIAHPARGVRQAAHRARRRARCWSPARRPGGRTERLIDELGIAEHVSFVNGISDAELVEVMGSAEVACVPSLYEGFSLPTAELMACETPLVVSRAGAIPEVVGPDGECADLVTPGDVGELERGDRRAARRPGAPRADGHGRACPGAGAVQLARGRRGHRGGVRASDRRAHPTDRGETHADR